MSSEIIIGKFLGVKYSHDLHEKELLKLIHTNAHLFNLSPEQAQEEWEIDGTFLDESFTQIITGNSWYPQSCISFIAVTKTLTEDYAHHIVIPSTPSPVLTYTEQNILTQLSQLTKNSPQEIIYTNIF